MRAVRAPLALFSHLLASRDVPCVRDFSLGSDCCRLPFFVAVAPVSRFRGSADLLSMLWCAGALTCGDFDDVLSTDGRELSAGR